MLLPGPKRSEILARQLSQEGMLCWASSLCHSELGTELCALREQPCSPPGFSEAQDIEKGSDEALQAIPRASESVHSTRVVIVAQPVTCA